MKRILSLFLIISILASLCISVSAENINVIYKEEFSNEIIDELSIRLLKEMKDYLDKKL